MSKHIKIFDTTLRDGEQSPGCSMNLKEKCDVALQLENLGVDCIEAGFAISSKGDFESIQAISELVKSSIVCSLCRAVDADIETAALSLKKAARKRIHTFIATSPIHMQYKLNMTEEQVLERAVKAVKLARNFVDDVEFSCEDAGRSNPEFLARVFSEVIKAGATVINVPDTVGYLTPNEFGDLIRYLSNHVIGVENVDISVHCHNDLGLATANALAGVLNGATQIECTINGIGERAGNTALEEVVMALKVRESVFNCFTNINTKEITKTSRLVSHITGSVVQANKAIVGSNAFAHEAGIHQDGMLKQRNTYEIMEPEMIGLGKTNLVLGKHSGRHAFKDKLSEMGYKLNDTDIQKSFERFKALADKKKEVLEEDLHSLVSDDNYQENSLYSLEYFEVQTNNLSRPKALVRLNTPDGVIEKSEEGAGSVDALYNTIDSIANEDFELLDYAIQAVTEGTDALGEVVVRLKKGERVFTGRGSSTDVLLASVKAYIHAINKVLSAKELDKRIKPNL